MKPSLTEKKWEKIQQLQTGIEYLCFTYKTTLGNKRIVNSLFFNREMVSNLKVV